VAIQIRPGVFAKLFAEVAETAQAKTRQAMTAVAMVAESQAKINVSTGSHRYGTPTVAHPGAGPSVVSGTLRRSITHMPTFATGSGFATMVGAAPGFYPPYPHHSRDGGAPKRTMSSRYGYYQETGLRNGSTYPWLQPACKWAMGTPAQQLFAEAFSGGWPSY
jgi:hypothetical protein